MAGLRDEAEWSDYNLTGLRDKAEWSDYNLTELLSILNKTVDHVDSLAMESDKLFLIVMSIIIFFMQCGFAFLEAGAVR